MQTVLHFKAWYKWVQYLETIRYFADINVLSFCCPFAIDTFWEIPRPPSQRKTMRNIFRCRQMLEEGWVGEEEAEAQTQPWAALSAFGQCLPARQTRRRRCWWEGRVRGWTSERGERRKRGEGGGEGEVVRMHEGEWSRERMMIHMCWHRWLQDFGHQNNEIVTFAEEPYFFPQK